MSDSITDVTSESWLGRIGNSIKSVLIGLVMFVIAFPLLFWNEGRAVEEYKTLKEGAGAVVSLPSPATIDPTDNGKLVHLTGKADTKDVLRDDVFPVQATALRLNRNVEMYQWLQNTESKTRKKVGGGTETVKTYTYTHGWSKYVHDSSGFKQPDGHQNPATMPFQPKSWTADKVSLGSFTLPTSLVNQISGDKEVQPDAARAKQLTLGEPVHVVGDSLYLGDNPVKPQVGDMRVSFQAVYPAEVSVIAQQSGNTFQAYQAKSGGTIEMLHMGQIPAAAMFKAAQASNAKITWGLRVAGFLAMTLGLGLIFNPLAVVADVIPLIGDILRFGIGIFAVAIAAPLSMITIAIAWIFYRPLLGIGLLVVAGGIIAVMKWRAPQKAAA